jgi:endoglucanase
MLQWTKLRKSLVSAGAAAAVVLAGGAARAAGWSTSGTRILDPAGAEFLVSGINWYGFETRDGVAHGLYSKDYRYILGEIKQFGFNTVRLPFSNSMWETNPRPGRSKISACPDCAGRGARDILALIVSYAGSIGLHVILDNHRSTEGNSAEDSGLWYTPGFPESAWIRDWTSIQQWMHGIPQSLGAPDTITTAFLASDGFPTVIGFDLRNEPHSPSTRTSPMYLSGATWGTGDGLNPALNPNPNPFAPACVANSTCRDWRLAAERAADTVFGAAAAIGWDLPLVFVEGIGLYPTTTGTPAAGPYDGTWWGANLLGVNGNGSNPGAPVVLNAGGTASSLGAAVTDKLVYSAHDYGPTVAKQDWFKTNTCYRSGCTGTSLADTWKKFWAYINLGQVNPIWPGHDAYPWGNTGHLGYAIAPIYIGEFGTGNASGDLTSAVRGSQGQWFTDLVNFIASSRNPTQTNAAGLAVTSLSFSNWSLNTEDSMALLGTNYDNLVNPAKVFTYLCAIEAGPLTGAAQCGSTGALPNPF